MWYTVILGDNSFPNIYFQFISKIFLNPKKRHEIIPRLLLLKYILALRDNFFANIYFQNVSIPKKSRSVCPPKQKTVKSWCCNISKIRLNYFFFVELLLFSFHCGRILRDVLAPLSRKFSLKLSNLVKTWHFLTLLDCFSQAFSRFK